MDEFYLIYTPMIKVLQERGGYFYGNRKISYTNTPSHVIFIGDLHPTLEKDIPADIDQQIIRSKIIHSMINQKYDEKITSMISECIYVKGRIQITKKRGISDSLEYYRLIK